MAALLEFLGCKNTSLFDIPLASMLRTRVLLQIKAVPLPEKTSGNADVSS